MGSDSKSDQAVIDRNVNYTKEILRLSFLAIIILMGVFSFLVYKIKPGNISRWEIISLLAAFTLLSIAMIFSIIHRNIITAMMSRLSAGEAGIDQVKGVTSVGSGALKIAIYFFTIGIVFFAVAILLMCIYSFQTNAFKNSGDDDKIEVDFVQVNDVYEIAPLDKGKIGGMARVATFKRQCVAKNPNTMLVIAGDFLSPSVYNNIKQGTGSVAGRQMIDAMNAAAFDLAIFGNHEFDISQNQLNLCISESNFQWLSSNTFVKGGKREHFKKDAEDIPETFVKEFVDEDGTVAKVGFMGLTINSNSAPYVEYDTTFDNQRKIYEDLIKRCDAVVAITHQSVEQDVELARKLPGLAVIIGGHEHDMQFKKVGNVYITKAHANAKSVFYLKLKIDKKNKTTSLYPELRCLDSTVELDCLTNAIVNKWNSYSNDYFKKSGFSIESVIYHGPPLDGRDEQVRKDGSNELAKIVVQAMESAYPGVVLAVFNAGSIRIDDVLESPLTQYDILRALPFGGAIKKASIRGDTLIRMLDIGLKNAGTGGFLQYSSSVTKKADGWYIKNLKINDLTNYTVAIAQYLTDGKDQSMSFLKDIRILDSAKSGVNDIKSDIRLAVINQMTKLTGRK